VSHPSASTRLAEALNIALAQCTLCDAPPPTPSTALHFLFGFLCIISVS
jgi:hypothetical protein